MKKWILRALVLLFLLALTGGGSSSAAIIRPQQPHLQGDPNAADQEALNGSCGVERWSVKTGTDADAGLINLQSTTQTTIASLISPSPKITERSAEQLKHFGGGGTKTKDIHHTIGEATPTIQPEDAANREIAYDPPCECLPSTSSFLLSYEAKACSKMERTRDCARLGLGLPGGIHRLLEVY